jgi:hypothetical protein
VTVVDAYRERTSRMNSWSAAPFAGDDAKAGKHIERFDVERGFVDDD